MKLTKAQIKQEFDELDRDVIRILIDEDKISSQDAASKWLRSKTRAYVHQANLYYIAPTRCYWELELETEGNPDWMTEPI